jgi:hypothetical protein
MKTLSALVLTFIAHAGYTHTQWGTGPGKLKPCGVNGSISERIKNCSTLPGSTKEGFILVTRTKEYVEIYKDSSSGLLWSATLPYRMKQIYAARACHPNLKEVAGITNVSWRLPTKREFDLATANGIEREIPKMNDWFWTSDEYEYDIESHWAFNGGNGFSDILARDEKAAVRCVAKVIEG